MQLIWQIFRLVGLDVRDRRVLPYWNVEAQSRSKNFMKRRYKNNGHEEGTNRIVFEFTVLTALRFKQRPILVQY